MAQSRLISRAPNNTRDNLIPRPDLRERAAYTFSELISRGWLEIGDGYRAKNDELAVDGSGPIFLRAGHVTDTIDLTGTERFRADSPALAGKLSMAGDVVVTTKGASTGRTVFVPKAMAPFVYSPHLSYWRSRDKSCLEPGYLRYWAHSKAFTSQLQAMEGSTDMAPYLSLTDQRRLRIALPPLPEQRAIAHILGTLDDKIELNRRTNETLEAMARALFKSWFVDFDPVHAKKAGRKPEGMDAETAALFPDDFEDSEMGKIPRGWRVAPLSSLTSYLSRGIGPSYVEHGGVRVVNQKCVRAGVVDFSKARRHDVTRRGVDDRILLDGDILVNSTGVGTLGRVAQADTLSEPTIVDSHVTIVRPREVSLLEFLGTSMTSREGEIEALGEGSTGQTELSRQRLGALSFVVPPDVLTRAFAGFAAPSRRSRARARAQSETLAALRDALLPQLLSGSLRVPEAMRLVEKVI